MKLGRTIKLNLGGRGQIRNIPKVVRPLWTKAHFLAIAANKADQAVTSGAMTLKNVNTPNGYLPLHVYDLTLIGSLEHPGQDRFAYEYQNDGYWAQLSADPGIASGPLMNGVEQGLTGINDIARCTAWLHQNTKIKLLLYSRAKQSTTFEVIFFRCPQAETTPGAMGFEGRKPELNQNIYHKLLYKYTVNPVNVMPDILSLTRQTEKHVQILKRFKFEMREQLSTEDVIQKTSVNFNVSFNKVKHHVPDEGFPAVTDINDVEELTLTDYSNNRNAFITCHARQRVYMAIMATNYEVEGNANYAPPTYDVAFDKIALASELSRRF